MQIDINCDIGETVSGEGMTRDANILQFVSSCNITCGSHAGTENSIKESIRHARHYGVSIGAHPSYPDKENYGRKRMLISANQLTESLVEQLRFFASFCKSEDISHVKPHGALYHDCMHHAEYAACLLNAIEQVNWHINLFGQPGSELQKLCTERGVPFIPEAFGDRKYDGNLDLIDRTNPESVITNVADALGQVLSMIDRNLVETTAGLRSITPRTICFHSDTPGSLKLIKSVVDELKNSGISIQSWNN